MCDHRLLRERCTHRPPPRILGGVLGLLVFLLPLPADAIGIRWLCWHQQSDETIHCFFDGAVFTAADKAAADAETARLAVTLPANLPGFVRELRLDPLQFAHDEIVVPLFAMPFDPLRVQELAQAVMCGDRRACTAVISENALSLELLRRLDDDPALE